MKFKKSVIISVAAIIIAVTCLTLASCVKINTPQFNKKHTVIKMEDCAIQTHSSGKEASIGIDLEFRIKTDKIEPLKFTVEINGKVRDISIIGENGVKFKEGDVIASDGGIVSITINSRFELLNKGYKLAVYYDNEVAVTYEMSHKD